MTTYRIKFRKENSVKYVSHLDTVNVFSRALRRADLPAAYSQGFNPKPHMVFGVPAAVGMTSESEIMDLTLEKELSCDEVARRLNDNLPAGFRIDKCIIKDTVKNIMALVKAAEYIVRLRFDNDAAALKNAIETILNSTEVLMDRTTKSGSREVNIRTMVYEASVQEDTSLKLLLTTGNEGGLKPELFVGAVNKINPCINADVLSVHRTGMYVEGDNGLIDPFTKSLRWSDK